MSDYLCEDLIAEIFTWLPPKSLLRFRSLSKSLYKRISSPKFIRMHTFRSPQKILFIHSLSDYRVQPLYTLHGEDELPLLLCPERGYIGMTTTATFPRGTTFRTVGYCHGTFCLENENHMSLWNPAIRRKLRVPERPWKSQLPKGEIGFGYDPMSDDYKIVWISYVRDISFVYAVKTGTWCKIASSKPPIFHVSYEAFFFNGVLHWELHHLDIKSQNPYGPPSHILTFDLSTHVFGMIPSPGHPRDWLLTTMTTIQDSLALVSYRVYADNTWIRVWRDASWSVVYKLGTGQLTIWRALQLQPQPNNNGDWLFQTLEEGVNVYNPKTGVLLRVVDFNATSKLVGFRQCVETLHLLDMGETACETDQL